jgi:hypothetical protein
LFKRLYPTLVTRVDPLAWWQIYETQFPNIGVLAKQILGISRLQIETEHVLSHASVLTTLKHCRLQVDNLDSIIIVVKNWPNDPHLNCSRHKDLNNFLKVEYSLAEDNYDLIEESNYFEQLELNKD